MTVTLVPANEFVGDELIKGIVCQLAAPLNNERRCVEAPSSGFDEDLNFALENWVKVLSFLLLHEEGENFFQQLILSYRIMLVDCRIFKCDSNVKIYVFYCWAKSFYFLFWYFHCFWISIQ